MSGLLELVAALGSWPGARWLQGSGTAYLIVNALHILGIGLLLGAVLPLDLKVLGAFRSVPLAVVGPFLLRFAAIGLVLALATGLWLFTVRPLDYAANPAFLVKLALLAAALGNVLLQSRDPAWRRALAGGAVGFGAKATAALSAAFWLSTLLAGRWIGFL